MARSTDLRKAYGGAPPSSGTRAIALTELCENHAWHPAGTFCDWPDAARVPWGRESDNRLGIENMSELPITVLDGARLEFYDEIQYGQTLEAGFSVAGESTAVARLLIRAGLLYLVSEPSEGTIPDAGTRCIPWPLRCCGSNKCLRRVDWFSGAHKG
jgi:hypothetical protein